MESALAYSQPAPQQGRRLPDFMIIGAAKSGTTSLAQYLTQHPGVYFSPYKEPNFFALTGCVLPQGGPAPANILFELLHRHTVVDLDQYLSLFAQAGSLAAGEASVRYLYYPEAPVHIQQTIPDVRLVAILRDPIERLYSHYCMNVQHQLEPLSLMEALEQEGERVALGWGWDWHYVRLGYYAQQLQRFYDVFPADQIKVFLYQDFAASPLTVFREVCRHIGVDDEFEPDMSRRQKAAYRPRSFAVDRWLHWPAPSRSALESILPTSIFRRMKSGLRLVNSGPVPSMDPGLRKKLQPVFQDDARELSLILDRDIPWASSGN